jgi:FtsP/CotA-like multicopper oxidase with cupredoxin domain
VKRGLYGSLVVKDPANPPEATDLVVAGHTLNGLALLGASDRLSVHAAPAGTPVRLRLINTDSLPQRYVLAGAAFMVAAVDGTAVHEPQEVSWKILRIGAGGRLDVVFRMPDAPVSLQMEAAASAAVVLRPPEQPAGSRLMQETATKLPAAVLPMSPNWISSPTASLSHLRGEHFA